MEGMMKPTLVFALLLAAASVGCDVSEIYDPSGPALEKCASNIKEMGKELGNCRDDLSDCESTATAQKKLTRK
jgi:hypothetical protein